MFRPDELSALAHLREQERFKDECGVVGVHGHAEASNIAYLGLYALQHRGQESAGICSTQSGEQALTPAWPGVGQPALPVSQ